MNLLVNALTPSDETSLIVVDGFPRTKAQLELFNQRVCVPEACCFFLFFFVFLTALLSYRLTYSQQTLAKC